METLNESSEIEKYWDKACVTYSNNLEMSAAPYALLLASQTKAENAKNVLEVGAGSGMGAMLIRQILKPGSIYCCSDISKGMLDLFKKRCENSDFAYNPNNSIEFHYDDTYSSKISPSKHEKSGISLQVYKSDNENLPFNDSCFDSYIAAVSLHIVSNPAKMLTECHRVLKKGGIAAFSIPCLTRNATGNPFMAVHKKVAQNNLKLNPMWSIMKLSENELDLQTMLQKAEFKEIKITRLSISNEEYAEKLSKTLMSMYEKGLEDYPLEMKTEILKEFKNEAGKLDSMKTHKIEFMVIRCIK